MLQELIKLTETLDSEEDGGIIIVCAAWQNDKEDLELGLDLETGQDDIQKWTLTCKSEREHRLIFGWGDTLEVSNDHVLLWPHNKTVCELWFTGSNEDVSAVVGVLWKIHYKLVGNWFTFTHFLNYSHDFAGLLSGGHGKLAEGPEPLIIAYQQVMKECGFITSVTTRPPLHWNGQAWVDPGNLVVLLVSKSYVIASSIEAHK